MTNPAAGIETHDVNKVREEMVELSRDTNTCEAFRVFSLDANGTAMVMCGLAKGHDASPEPEPVNVEEFATTVHQAVRTEADGAIVLFQWPV